MRLIIVALLVAKIFATPDALFQEQTVTPRNYGTGAQDANVANEQLLLRWRQLLKRPDFDLYIPKIREHITLLVQRKEGREDALSTALAGYGLIGDEEGRRRTEAIILEEFPGSKFVREILFRRINEEPDSEKKAALIEDFVKRYPDQNSAQLFGMFFRHLASLPEQPAIKLLKIGNGWIDAASTSAYATADAISTVVMALAERRAYLDHAQGLADRGVTVIDSLQIGSPLLKDTRQDDQPGLIAILKERVHMARGYLLLRRRQFAAAEKELAGPLQPIIAQVERDGVTVWREQLFRAIGVRPRVLWLAELYEGKGELQRAARYLLAGFADDERINKQIREQLYSVYEKLGRSRETADAAIGSAEDRFHALTASTPVRKEDQRTRALGQRAALPAPDFELETLDKRKVRLSDLKGKVVIINFWATWCGPCLYELPLLQKAYEKYSRENRVVFLAVSVDDNRALVKPFVERHRYEFPVAYDSGAAIGFRVSGIPATFFIGPSGTVQYQEVGFGGSGEGFLERMHWRIEELLKDDGARQ